MQLSHLFLAAVAAVGVFAQTPDPAINTPSGASECLPVQLTFSGSAPPFIITVQPGGQAGAAPLTTVGTTSSNAITWNVNIPAGTQCTLVIRDSLGRTNPSGVFTILPGNTDCLNGSSSAATGGSAVSTPAGSTTPAATTPAGTTPTTPANSPANTPTTTPAAAGGQSTVKGTTTAAASATTSKSSASSIQPMCLAGFLGIAGVAAALL